MNSEIAAHIAQEDQLAAYFEARPDVLVTHDDLVAEVGENYRSRISPLRKKRGMVIDNVPVFKADGTRGYGSYIYRSNPLGGRDASAYVPGNVDTGTLFNLQHEPSGWQESR